MLIKKILLFSLVMLFGLNSWAIIIRDDRDDQKYIELGRKFPAAGLILPRVGVGTLIAPQWVLTAAHVAQNLPRNARIAFEGKEYPIESTVLYPDWKEEQPGDIALLHLSHPVQGIDPVAPYTGNEETGQIATFAGYGATGTGLTGRDHEDGKKRAATNKVDSADHDWIYFVFDREPQATDLEGISGPGDSGGPALIENGKKWNIAGISVWGDSNGKTPGSYGQKEGYTRVSTYAGWIASTLKQGTPKPGDEDVDVSAAQRLPDTEGGKIAAAYIEAFNSSEEAMDRFQQQYMLEKTLQSRPKEQRMARYREMKEMIGSLEFNKMLSSGNNMASILARSGKGEWLQLDFELDPGTHKLVSLRIDQSQGPGESSPAESLTEDQLVPSIDAYLKALVAKDDFSGVVLVAKKGKPVYEKAFGLASKRYGVPNRVDTKFCIGSINKDFTSVAIQQLAKAGKLSLDDTIDRYLPDFPKDKASKITIRQLLKHRSGLGDFFGDKYVMISKDKLRGNNDYIPLFRDNPLEFEPGTDQRYSNAGYVLLGAIIEKVSGQDYYEYIRSHVTGPLDMRDTDSYAVDEETPNLATGYTYHYEGDEPDSANRRSNVLLHGLRPSAAGGGYSTAQDLLKFALALQARKLPAPGGEEAPGDEVPSFGLAGGAPGLNALIEALGDKDYVFVVLANYDPPIAETIGKKIRGWIQNLKH